MRLCVCVHARGDVFGDLCAIGGAGEECIQEVALWTVGSRPGRILPFGSPDLGAPGEAGENAEAASHPAGNSNEFCLWDPTEIWMWGAVGRGSPSVTGSCVQGGCGTFQRRLGGVCVAGQASGGFGYPENSTEVRSQRGHRRGPLGSCDVGPQNRVRHSGSVFFNFFFKMTLKSHVFCMPPPHTKEHS